MKRLGVAPTEIHNLTKCNLPQDVKDCLLLGTKFIPTPNLTYKKSSQELDFQTRCRWLWKHRKSLNNKGPPDWYIPTTYKPPNANWQIEKQLDLLTKKLLSVQVQKPHYNWHKKLKHSLQSFLNNRPDLLVFLADKNLGYTVVTTDWYKEAAVKAHLHKYEDCTSTFMKKI